MTDTKNDRKAARAAARAAAKAAKAQAVQVEQIILEEEEATTLTAGAKMAAQLRAARARYHPTTSYSGNKSLHNGDPVADLLAGRSPEETYVIVEGKLGLAPGTLAAKYAHLNPGQRRMNAGNMLRGAVKRGTVEV